jgi:hypothetical protein
LAIPGKNRRRYVLPVRSACKEPSEGRAAPLLAFVVPLEFTMKYLFPAMALAFGLLLVTESTASAQYRGYRGGYYGGYRGYGYGYRGGYRGYGYGYRGYGYGGYGYRSYYSYPSYSYGYSYPSYSYGYGYGSYYRPYYRHHHHYYR